MKKADLAKKNAINFEKNCVIENAVKLDFSGHYLVWYSKTESSMKGFGEELAATLLGGGTGLMTTGKRHVGSWLSI